MRIILLFLIRRILKYSSPIITLFEKKKIRRYAKAQKNDNIIFIIGAPRTGSTILYQLITNELEVTYFDNLIQLGYKNLYFGTWLSSKFFKNKPHNCFTSTLGNTFLGGLHAPGENGAFWYRFIPQNMNYISQESLSQVNISQLQMNLQALLSRYPKPLLIKNNTNSLRLNLIREMFPDAKFIYIKRDPLYTAQSLIKARETHSGNIDIWWSIKPPNFDTVKKSSPISQVVQQVYYIEKQIETDIKLFSDKKLLRVDYSEIQSKDELLKKISDFIGNVNRRKKYSFAEIIYKEKQKVNNSVFEELKQEISKYDWELYSS